MLQLQLKYDYFLAGRLQSSKLALDLVSNCVMSGRLHKSIIFLHDVHRPLEQEIASRMFLNNTNIFFMGTMKGPFGDLSGFEFSKNVRQNIVQ